MFNLPFNKHGSFLKVRSMMQLFAKILKRHKSWIKSLSKNHRMTQGTCKVRYYSSVYTFGKNYFNQCGVPEQVDQLIPRCIMENVDVKYLSTGWAHNMILDGNGDVYGWGHNQRGQLGIPVTEDNIKTPTMIRSLRGLDIERIDCGETHTLFLTKTGQVYAIGDNHDYQLGLGFSSEDPIITPCLVESLKDDKIVDITTGSGYSLALSETGLVYEWGRRHGDLIIQYPTIMDHVYNIKKIDMGLSTVLAVRDDGTFYLWGDNSQGQYGFNFQKVDFLPPVQVGLIGEEVIEGRACGVHFVLLTKSGKLFSWGFGYSGRIGIGSESNISYPQHLNNLKTKIKHISCTGGHSLALSMDHKVYSWGFGEGGRIGNGISDDMYIPSPIKHFENKKVVGIDTGLDHSVLVCEDS